MDKLEADLQRRTFASEESLQSYTDFYQQGIMAFFADAMEEIIETEMVENKKSA